jgi:hypothetical protein
MPSQQGINEVLPIIIIKNMNIFYNTTKTEALLNNPMGLFHK